MWIFSNKELMGLNPASINLDTGLITINRDVWCRLSQVQRKLILLHEKAHKALDTLTDEIACDRWALERFAGTEKNSLRKALDAYAGLLDKNYIDVERKKQILQSLLTIDAERFGNKRAENLLAKFNQTTQNNGNFVEWIAAGAALVSLGTQTILGKRNGWAPGKVSEKTTARISILTGALQMVIGKYVETYALAFGLAYIEDKVNNRAAIQEAVFSQMVASGLFEDKNIFSKNWKNSGEFFKKYTWVRAEIDKIANEVWLSLKERLVAEGHKDDTKPDSGTNWLLWGGLALGGLILIKKLL